MNRFRTLFVLITIGWLTAVASASQPGAALVQKEYQVTMEKWSLELKLANTPAAREEVMRRRPDPYAFSRRMWKEIGLSLKEEWTLEPSAWFLSLSSGLMTQNPDGGTAPTFAKETDAIRAAIEAYHIDSNKLAPLCLALAYRSDPKALSLLEKIESTNPDKKVQGVAALAAAMVLKSLGDNPELMKKRLTLLRKAIIQSAEVELNGTTVAKLADDELYIIKFLTKGRVAPDLQGFDSGKRPLRLSDHKGKVIVLMFWNSTLFEIDRLVQFSTSLEEKFKGRPFVLIGVNNDHVEKLREMEASGIRWLNFSDPENKLAAEYRVGTWPLAYVLDGERKIQHAGAPGSFVELTVDALLSPPQPAAK
jgi:peroxiredoxin